jgi:hypothetical protein
MIATVSPSAGPFPSRPACAGEKRAEAHVEDRVGLHFACELLKVFDQHRLRLVLGFGIADDLDDLVEVEIGGIEIAAEHFEAVLDLAPWRICGFERRMPAQSRR